MPSPFKSLAVILFTLLLVHGAPISELRRNAKPVLSRDAGCSFDGNADFYGLGIRLGVYLQWITSLIANHLVADYIDEALDTNTILLLALFIAMVIATAQETIRPVETAILLQLCFGFMFSVMSIWGLRLRSQKDPIRFPLIGSFFRLAIGTAICAYLVRFWYIDVNQQDLSPHPECDSIFLFTKVNIQAGAKVFFQIFSMLLLLSMSLLLSYEAIFVAWVYGLTAIVAIPLIAFYGVYEGFRDDEWSMMDLVTFWFWKGPSIAAILFWARVTSVDSVGNNRGSLSFLLNYLVQRYKLVRLDGLYKRLEGIPAFDLSFKILIYASNIINLFWSFLFIELTLYFNGVSGIYTIQSTGQLIPLIIGVAGFLRLLHRLIARDSGPIGIDMVMTLFDYDDRPRVKPVGKGMFIDKPEVPPRNMLPTINPRVSTRYSRLNSTFLLATRPRRRHSSDRISAPEVRKVHFIVGGSERRLEPHQLRTREKVWNNLSVKRRRSFEQLPFILPIPPPRSTEGLPQVTKFIGAHLQRHDSIYTMILVSLMSEAFVTPYVAHTLISHLGKAKAIRRARKQGLITSREQYEEIDKLSGETTAKLKKRADMNGFEHKHRLFLYLYVFSKEKMPLKLPERNRAIFDRFTTAQRPLLDSNSGLATDLTS